MKQAILFFVLSITALIAQAAEPRAGAQPYDPSPEYPYGRPNPDAPPQLSQFHFMVGRNDCKDEVFNPSTEQWLEGQRTQRQYSCLRSACSAMAGHLFLDAGIWQRRVDRWLGGRGDSPAPAAEGAGYRHRRFFYTDV